MSLQILYQDDDFAAVYKPAGLLVHRSFIDAGETRFCVQMLRDQLEQEVFPCHRLDKPTCGILLFALNQTALKQAQAAFRSGGAFKQYLAVVRGWIPEAGRIDYPLRYEKDDYERGADGKVQEARTDFLCLEKTELPVTTGRYPNSRYSLVELTPSTGRKHQLRRHLAHLRHPIVGDTRHGDGAQNRCFRTHLNSHRLLLVATNLAFSDHPGMDHIQITTAPDDDFLRVIEAAGFQRNLFYPATRSTILPRP